MKHVGMAVLASALVVPCMAAANPEARSKQFIKRLDKDNDGKLSREEYPERMRRLFDRIDKNKDGFVTVEEDVAFRKNRRPRRPRTPLPKPDHANVKYGPHERNVFDLWLASSDKPTPLVIYYHGGGFQGGDKRSLGGALLNGLRQAGVSVAAANYRLTDTAIYPAQMHDAARCLQYIRLNAKQYNIDPARVGATGGSAGAGISLWLAFHDDLADAKNEDPVLQQSTRISCAVVYGGQSTYDPRVIMKLFDTKQVHPALIKFYGMKGPADVTDPKFHPLFEQASAMTHVTKGDPPVMLYYGQANKPLPPNSSGGAHIHHPKFGIVLKEKCDPLGVECVVKFREDYGPGKPNPNTDQVTFFLDKLGVKPAPKPVPAAG